MIFSYITFITKFNCTFKKLTLLIQRYLINKIIIIVIIIIIIIVIIIIMMMMIDDDEDENMQCHFHEVPLHPLFPDRIRI